MVIRHLWVSLSVLVYRDGCSAELDIDEGGVLWNSPGRWPKANRPGKRGDGEPLGWERGPNATGRLLVIENRAKRLLDYRYYHRYDLEMINVGASNGVKAQPISLGRSGVNLSGGENQAPFFISMLAAFRRVYDLGSGRSNHLGLVVMDEAFAKLSGDGVEDCLELAKEFDLQLLMAFPVDRLGVMAPFAQTKTPTQRPEEILRIMLPLEAEPRLRTLFADELPQKVPTFDFGSVEDCTNLNSA